MKEWVRGFRDRRFILYSGHDQNIAAVLVALGAFDGHRPPYASRLVFELWTAKGRTDADSVVRTIYNGRVIQSHLINGTTSLRSFAERLMTGSLRSRESHTRACLSGTVWLLDTSFCLVVPLVCSIFQVVCMHEDWYLNLTVKSNLYIWRTFSCYILCLLGILSKEVSIF